MTDKSSLLEQLRIERPAEIDTGGKHRFRIITLAALVIAVGGMGAGWFLFPRGLAVAAATAAPAPTDVVVGPTAVLDAGT